QFVPKPLAGSGEIEEVILDRELVDESNPPPGGMAGIGPIAHFKQHRLEDADLDHLAADAFNFHPIPDADAVRTDECEPTEERHDEILEGDGKSGGGESDDGRRLGGYSQ